MTLFLASRSETRRRMLDAAGIPFESVDAALDEEDAKAGLIAAGFGAADLAEMLAETKARSAAPRPGGWIIGADQLLEQEDGSFLSKPRSRQDAFDQLQALGGRTHWLHSAAVIVRDGDRVWGWTESVAMKMRPLSSDFLHDYLDREYEQIKWSVGGYRIEGPGAQLFEAIEGSYFAILGLPLLPLLAFLRDQGLMPR